MAIQRRLLNIKSIRITAFLVFVSCVYTTGIWANPEEKLRNYVQKVMQLNEDYLFLKRLQTAFEMHGVYQSEQEGWIYTRKNDNEFPLGAFWQAAHDHKVFMERIITLIRQEKISESTKRALTTHVLGICENLVILVSKGNGQYGDWQKLTADLTANLQIAHNQLNSILRETEKKHQKMQEKIQQLLRDKAGKLLTDDDRAQLEALAKQTQDTQRAILDLEAQHKEAIERSAQSKQATEAAQKEQEEQRLALEAYTAQCALRKGELDGQCRAVEERLAALGAEEARLQKSQAELQARVLALHQEHTAAILQVSQIAAEDIRKGAAGILDREEKPVVYFHYQNPVFAQNPRVQAFQQSFTSNLREQLALPNGSASPCLWVTVVSVSDKLIGITIQHSVRQETVQLAYGSMQNRVIELGITKIGSLLNPSCLADIVREIQVAIRDSQGFSKHTAASSQAYYHLIAATRDPLAPSAPPDDTATPRTSRRIVPIYDGAATGYSVYPPNT